MSPSVGKQHSDHTHSNQNGVETESANPVHKVELSHNVTEARAEHRAYTHESEISYYYQHYPRLAGRSVVRCNVVRSIRSDHNFDMVDLMGLIRFVESMSYIEGYFGIVFDKNCGIPFNTAIELEYKHEPKTGVFEKVLSLNPEIKFQNPKPIPKTETEN